MAAERNPLENGMTTESCLEPLSSVKTFQAESGLPSFPIEDVYVHPEELPEYLIEHPYIQYRRLENGVQIFGLDQETPETIDAKIMLTFVNGGAWRSPVEKAQLSHYSEHLTALSFKDSVYDSLNDYDASTGSREIIFGLDGFAHLTVRSVGVWPALERIRDALTDPIALLRDALGVEGSETIIKNERHAILAEMQNDDNQPERKVQTTLMEMIFGGNNPLNALNLETVASIHNITIADLEEHVKMIFNPSDLVISIFSEGKNCKDLVDKIAELFEGCKTQSNQRDLEFPLDRADQLNPNIIPGVVYEADTGIENGQVSLILAWPINRIPFSEQDYALQKFATLTHDRFFQLARGQMGLAYDARGYVIDNNGNQAILVLSTSVPKPSADGSGFDTGKLIESGYVERVKQAIFEEQLTNDVLEKKLEIEQKVRDLKPISRRKRYELAVLGLLNYNVIINADRAKEVEGKVCLSDFTRIRQYLLENDPYIFLIGDLSERQSTRRNPLGNLIKRWRAN